MALKIFPADIAEEMKECAEKASWSCAKERKGKRGEADAEKVAFEQHADAFKKKSVGLLSPNTCDDIKWMFWNAAWHTANTRAGYSSDASRDKAKMEEHYRNIVKNGEVTEKLASDLKWMGWNAAWYAANTSVGYRDDAKRDAAKIQDHFQKIQGEVNLVSMNFFIDQAKLLTEKPNVIAEQTLVNKSNEAQTMAFKYSVTEGKTKSTSHTIGFNYGIKVGFEAGFFGMNGKYEASFSFSHSHTFSESISSGITKSYEFPLKAAPRSTYVAKAMVHEANMDVPYELVLDFGGQKKSFNGIWNGVAVSKSTYTVDEV